MEDLATSAPHVPRHRALVIDDEFTIRLALRRFFTRMGWSVDEASNGESGYSLIVLDARQKDIPPYDVIISDLRMPGLNGIELHDRVKAMAPQMLPRLIFSTGDIVSEEAANFVRTSECLVIQKPFELSALRETIEEMLRGRAGQPDRALPTAERDTTV
jgi:DNA-binding NtrC family response regulator